MALVSGSGRAFVLLWNPARTYWPIGTQYSRLQDAKARGGKWVGCWSTGARKQGITVGDVIYLRQVGAEPRGIVAAGVATTGVYVDRHWENAGPCHYVDIAWEWIAATDNQTIPLPFNQQAGGVEIPWETHLNIWEQILLSTPNL